MHSWTNGLGYQIIHRIQECRRGDWIRVGTKNRCTNYCIIILEEGRWDFLLRKFLAWEEKLDKMMTRLNCQYFSFLNISQLVPLLIVKDFALILTPIFFWDKDQIFGRCTQEELTFVTASKQFQDFHLIMLKLYFICFIFES